MFPNLPPVKLIEKFFYIYGHEWQWDKWCIMIEPDVENDNVNQNVKKLGEMGKMNRQGFTIMTPAFPQANATFNVNQYTKDTLIFFFKQGYEICKNALESNELLTENNKSIYVDLWRDMFKEYNFFGKYNHFLEVNVLGQEKDFYSWKGFIEAKIRFTAKYFDDFSKMYR